MRGSVFVLLVIMLTACGTLKTVRTSKKVLKGNWNLTSITYNKSGTYNVTLFNDESKACFENSTWQFIPNNNTGIYTINGSSCSTGDRHIIFTVDEVDETTGLYDFLLKPTDAKGKSETNRGFRLKLVSLTETTMQWEQTISFEGSPFVITMNFDKL